MGSVDCIVLGGGHLSIGEGNRNSCFKGSELINERRISDYVIQSVKHSRKTICNIVYVGDEAEDDSTILYAEPAKGKRFLHSIKAGCDLLETVTNVNDRIIMVICGDCPLIGEKEIDYMLKHKPEGNDYLTLFGVSNDSLQREYPDFNIDKRYIELDSEDFIFGNAFLIKGNSLLNLLKKSEKFEDDGINPKKVFKFLTESKFNEIKSILRIFIYGNIKFLDGKIPRIIKERTKRPSQTELHKLLEIALSRRGIKIINNAPSELVVDYDRKHQLPFFENSLKNINN